jgi:Tfp pilus assembly protein PilF
MRKIFCSLLQVLLISFLLTSCAPVKVVDDEKEAEAHFMLGISYLQEQDHTRALKEFLTAENYDSSRVDIKEGIAQAYQLKQAYPEAEKYYLKALKINPDDPRIANNLASLYLDMGEWDKAIQYFKMANANLLFNNPEMALTGIGFAYFKKRDFEKARLYFEKAIKKKWNFAPAYFRMGELYLEQEKQELAKQSFQKAVDLQPNYVMPRFQLGLIQMKEKDIQNARKSFEKVVELAPETEIGIRAKDLLKVMPDVE